MKPSQPQPYEIRIQGHLAPRYSDWLGLNLEQGFHQGQPITILCGFLPDQSALHGVLDKLQAMGVTLLELKKLQPQP